MEDPDKITYFAKTNTRGKETPFGIKRKDRVRHMYVIGKTGMGKSTLLENMAIQDIRNGEGIAFIDPHGQTAERLLEYVPPHRIKDVLYFAPFDMDHPVAFNVMEDVGYDKRHLVVSGLLSAFRKIWVDAWSARMEYILSNTLLALLEYPDSTLLDVNRMLVDKSFRKKVIDNIQDPIVKSFWRDEFAGYTDRYTQEATPAIQNKIGQFTSNPLIRNIVGQSKSSFDMRRMMDEKKIIIINLSKGRVGEVNATLLGSMIVTKLYLSAMSRADVPASVLQGLPNFYFYVDEFQNFANESFADILSEARKYKLNLLIAHQYVEQMEEEVRDAVFGNVGTTVAFRVGPFDADTLETIFQPQFTKEDLVNLGFAQIYLTLMIDGVGSQPFSATTLPPFDPSPQNMADKVIDASRAAYGRSRQEVEANIEDRQRPDPLAEPVRARTADRPLRRAEGTGERPRAASAPRYASERSPERQERPEPRASEPAPVRTEPVRAQGRPENPPRPQHQPKYQERKTEAPARSMQAGGPPGIHSLKEAIALATGGQSALKAQPAHTSFAPAAPPAKSLKDALSAIAPRAASVPAAPPSRETERPQAAPALSRAQVGMPERELREMLAVDTLPSDASS